MLTRQEFLEHLQAQMEELLAVILDEVVQGDPRPLTKRPPDQAALAFCDCLISCATDDDLKSCVKIDIHGARACANVAEAAIAKIKNRAFQLLLRKPEQRTRFFFLASVVREYLKPPELK
jgi:hypothetical protein